MPKNLYIDKFAGNIFAALAENGKLLEYHIEKSGSVKTVGSIYKGVVENVLGGMEAAFVNVGLKKNGYLYVGDMLVDRADLEGKVDIPTALSLKKGDELMVVATKDPEKNKGARLSAVISLAGRLLVYLPNFEIIGVSRKITDEGKRAYLKSIVASFKSEGTGYIIRTAAENATVDELKEEAEELYETYERVVERYNAQKGAGIVYEDGDLPTRMLRDVYSSDVKNIIVGNKELMPTLMEAAKKLNGSYNKIQLFDKNVDMFDYFGFSREIEGLLKDKVMLSSGVYLYIERTEALTIIDVNTGKYIGADDLDETVYNANVAAAHEIARQVRLRNISGIVVVDFIDMDSAAYRVNLVRELELALMDDRARCNVLGMTGLGLVEFTRKKKRRGSIAHLMRPCPYCGGTGHIYSENYVVMQIRVKLLDCFNEGHKNALVRASKAVVDYIVNNDMLEKDSLGVFKEHKIYLLYEPMHEEQYVVEGIEDDEPLGAVLLKHRVED